MRDRTDGRGMNRSGRGGIARWTTVILGVAILGAPALAFAHGPTVEITHSEMKPPLLNLYVGSTVHFVNTVNMPGGHVVVDDEGRIESPPLAEPADDWHFTFEDAGTYELHLKQHPNAHMRIVVVPKAAPGSAAGSATPGS